MIAPLARKLLPEKGEQKHSAVLKSLGLRRRFAVAFCLMSVLPLLVLGYVMSNYVFPQWGVQVPTALSLIVCLVIGLSLMGGFLVRGVMLPISRMVSQMQDIAVGQVNRPIETETVGEEKELGVALNQITERVRNNMSQLRAYGEETRQLNLEINQRILSLSDVLQVSSLISQSGTVNEILNSILEKLSQVEHLELNILLEMSEQNGTFRVRAVSGTGAEGIKLLADTEQVVPWLRQVLRERRTFILDGEKTASPEGEILQQQFGMVNAVCQPIVVLGKEQGMLISANGSPHFTFQEDTLELFKIFSKQVSIAVENDLLAQRARELETKDELTGLYNASFIRSRLDEEIQRAVRYHRSCALAVLNLDNFRQFREQAGGLAAEKVLRQVAQLLQAQVTEVDRVGRMESDEFAMILPERNKRETVALLEKIRLKIEEHIFVRGQNKKTPVALTISAGISENPLDGDTAEVLLAKATEAMMQAKSKGKNRVMTV